MIIYKKAKDIKKYSAGITDKKQRTGFVPTMGALHQGHASLVRLSEKENDITIVSIFINPLQFNDRQDFEKYPVTLEKDLELLEQLGVDALFLPDEKEIYPEGEMVHKEYNLAPLDAVLEGTSRPGHFQGVARVMDVLLSLVQPDRLYLGQKDFQQVKIIQKIIELKDLKVKIVQAPIVREGSGLAMSSRNARLDEQARKDAAAIFKNLQYIKQHSGERSFKSLKEAAVKNLEKAGFKIDYLILANQDTLEEMEDFAPTVPMILLIAVHFHGVRLIDNLMI